MHSKILAAFLITFGVAVGSPVSAQVWGEWFADNTPKEGKSQVCRGGIDGVGCDGSRCHKMRLSCRDGDVTTTTVSITDWFSDEPPNNNKICPQGMVVTQIQARNAYSDDYRLYCSRLTSGNTLSDCHWVDGSISEEHAPAQGIYNPIRPGGDRVLAGMRCFYDYCDNKKLYFCSLNQKKSIDYAQLPVVEGGYWKLECTEQECQVTVADVYTVSDNLVKGWSSELETSISSKLSVSQTVGAEVDAGVAKASASTTVAAEIAAGLKNAVTRSQTKARVTGENKSDSLNCKIMVPPGKGGYFWVTTATIGDETVTRRSCLSACSDEPPTWQPGQNLGSCELPIPAG